jgi:hypothetical protein
MSREFALFALNLEGKLLGRSQRFSRPENLLLKCLMALGHSELFADCGFGEDLLLVVLLFYAEGIR